MNKRKKMVVDHAKALFLEKGIQQTSIQDIIERSGISKGTFYNYFSSKNECVAAILEQSRFETNIRRQELQLGKDEKDIQLLIQQITMLSRTNEQQGISGMFEEIMHSGDVELKKVVLQYRMMEIEWLADRLVEVFGDDLKPHAIEAAVMYYGMHQHLLFTAKIIHQQRTNAEQVANSVFHHLRHIINNLLHEGVAVLDPEKLVLFKNNFEQDHIYREELILLYVDLIANTQLTKVQQELTEALKQELERNELRISIINALLSPFIDAFRNTLHFEQAKEIMSVTWTYIKQKGK
ncbi:TetR/AcrR family transcriptional regulator [Paenibacillus septentrionalis]|uniref:TetR/AcrR family transcriptional regulator n=1 Tax=Paenibacillus septentrionalis TaxID=429342 RepID=A0ABW1V8H2_9BACL